jgi:hypothetical protein
MEFWKGIRGYEACISQIRRQNTNLKGRRHILRAFNHNSSSNLLVNYSSLPRGKYKQKLINGTSMTDVFLKSNTL